MFAEEHDNYELDYTRTYVGSDDSLEVTNTNRGGAANSVGVAANSGGNLSEGASGGDGSYGGTGTVSGASGQAGSSTGGEGGRGGIGGRGGEVRTGTADSAAEVITVSNRSVIRVTR